MKAPEVKSQTAAPLLDRLRAERKAAFYGLPDPLCEEAANEIERLRGLVWEVMSAPEAAYAGDWFQRATDALPCEEETPDAQS